jgi:hypothetical protein
MIGIQMKALARLKAGQTLVEYLISAVVLVALCFSTRSGSMAGASSVWLRPSIRNGNAGRVARVRKQQEQGRSI